MKPRAIWNQGLPRIGRGCSNPTGTRCWVFPWAQAAQVTMNSLVLAPRRNRGGRKWFSWFQGDSQTGRASPLQHLGTNRVRDGQVILGSSTRIWFLPLGFSHRPLYLPGKHIYYLNMTGDRQTEVRRKPFFSLYADYVGEIFMACSEHKGLFCPLSIYLPFSNAKMTIGNSSWRHICIQLVWISKMEMIAWTGVLE